MKSGFNFHPKSLCKKFSQERDDDRAFAEITKTWGQRWVDFNFNSWSWHEVNLRRKGNSHCFFFLQNFWLYLTTCYRLFHERTHACGPTHLSQAIVFCTGNRQWYRSSFIQTIWLVNGWVCIDCKSTNWFHESYSINPWHNVSGQRDYRFQTEVVL